MSVALLLEYYRELPEKRSGERSSVWARRMHAGLKAFKQKLAERYAEGTLQRLLTSTCPDTRQAAVLGLGMIGTMNVNADLAAMLHDEDSTVRHMASEAMWSVWFRADEPANNRELRRLMQLSSITTTLTGEILLAFAKLIRKSPTFAEAYNQRAVIYFRQEEWQKSITDCEQVLRLNPYHFGAAGGMAQCYVKLRKLKPALKAYRRMFRINPNLDGVREAIQSLEQLLEDGGGK